MGGRSLHVHDLQATMKKFDKDVRSVKVFDICHPDHSYEILSRDQERIVSNLMPCRIAVYEKNDGYGLDLQNELGISGQTHVKGYQENNVCCSQGCGRNHLGSNAGLEVVDLNYLYLHS